MGCSDICDGFDGSRVRNLVVSVISGVFFALAWWLIIDASVMYVGDERLPPAFHTIGVFATIAFVLVNSVPHDALEDGFSNRRCAIGCLTVAFAMSFSTLIAACWVFFGSYVATNKTPIWPGVALLLQNIFILISCLTYKFGRRHEII